MIMQVHDELVFEVKTEELERVSRELVDIMQSAVKLDVPLLAEAGSGPNWDQAH
jgi:DNA polymerase-1